MGVVAAPHHVLDTDEIAGADTNRIIFKGARELAVPVVTRLLWQRVTRDFAAVPGPGMVGAPEEIANPAGLEFRWHELQVRKALTHAAHDQVHERDLHANVGQR